METQIYWVSVIETMVFPLLVGIVFARAIYVKPSNKTYLVCVGLMLFASLFVNRFDWTGQADRKIERAYDQMTYMKEVESEFPVMEKAWDDKAFSEKEKASFEKVSVFFDRDEQMGMETLEALEEEPDSTKAKSRYDKLLAEVEWTIEAFNKTTKEG